MTRTYQCPLPALILAVLSLLIGGCAPAAGITPTPLAPTATTAPLEPTPTETATSVPTATPATAAEVSPLPLPAPVGPAVEMATFTDPQAGYSIDYPQDWYIQPAYGGVTIITTLDPGAPGRGGVPADETKIDVVPNPAGRPETLEEMAQRIRAETQVISEEEIELAAGIPAIRMEFTGSIGGHMVAVLALINGNSIQVQGYGDLEPFDTVALTLRPAE